MAPSSKEHGVIVMSTPETQPGREKALAYWNGRIAALPPGPDLPLAKNPDLVAHSAPIRKSKRFSEAQWKKFEALARDNKVTPSSALCTAYAEVISRWAKSPRFALAYCAASDRGGRFRTVLEIDFSDREEFRRRAALLQEQISRHCAACVIDASEILRLASEKTGHLLQLPVLFDAEGGLDASKTPTMPWIRHGARASAEGGVEIAWDAIDELFPAKMVHEMFETFCRCVERLANEPGSWTQKEVVSLSEEQLQPRLEANRTPAPIPPGLLQDGFFEQARLHPERTAVISQGRRLSYGELAGKANRLAAKLRSKGAKPNTLVAVVMEKGWEQVAAVLGILEAGAAYLPIDADLPKERLQRLIEQGEARIALTQPWLDSKIQWPGGIERIIVHDEEQTQTPGTPARGTARPTDIAYVIFTSGSTGVPKGVVIDHRGALNTIVDLNSRFHVGPNDRTLALSALNFDLSVYDIFGLLAAGGAIVLPDPESNRDPARWFELLNEHQVTVWNSVPALMEMAVTYAEEHGLCLPDSLRTVWMSGDWIPVTLPDRITRLRPGMEIVSMGGATEASIWSILYPIGKVDPGWRSVPYGKPLLNQQFHVLDSHLRPCPTWVPGQLFIGGIGVALGYWKDKQKTDASFIIHPQTGERLYRTGDMGCYLPDGNIEFLGREDTQVKISGFRIELGEIETALLQHADVKDAAVVAREDGGPKRLVAYAVPRAGKTIDVQDLKNFLSSKLPEYMVPPQFVPLEAMPLSFNGKVDRKALPAPGALQLHQGGPFIAPRTPVEQKLAEIWKDFLQVENIGVRDSFFELGGDSILTIQIISRARQFGIQFSPRQFFENPTIEDLAKVVTEIKASGGDEEPLTGEIPLTPIQSWFFEKNLPDAHHWNQALLFELLERPDPEKLKQAVEQLVLHHDALHLRFSNGPKGWRQRYVPPSDEVPFSHLKLESAGPQASAAITEAVTSLQSSLDLEKGPLIRVAYLDLGERQAGRLAIIIHHLAVDGVSWRILLEDLELAYKQLSRGEAASLSAKTTSYKRWAERLVEHADAPAIQAGAQYWLDFPADASFPLPADSEAPGENTEDSAEIITRALNGEETDHLLHQVPSAYNTQINDLLLAALVLGFQRTTGAHSLQFHLEGHGREDLGGDIDLARSVGWFTSIFPARLDVDGLAGPGQTIKSVKEQLRAIPGKGVGYGLIRYLRGNSESGRRLGALPEPEIAFNYLGQFDQVLAGSTLFKFAKESTGPWRSPRAGRISLIEVNAMVMDGRLLMHWSFSRNVHRRTTIEKAADQVTSALQELIRHCISPVAGGYTPSDFALAGLSQTQLDSLLSELDEVN